jgi:hypothetical protein
MTSFTTIPAGFEINNIGARRRFPFAVTLAASRPDLLSCACGIRGFSKGRL